MPQATEKFLLELLRSGSNNDLESALGYFCKNHDSLDWPLLLGPGFKVFFPLYCKVKSLSGGLKIPRAIMHKIELQCFPNMVKNKKIKSTVIKLAQEFTAAKLDLIFLKGAAFLFTIYAQDPALRMMADIDVLVDEGSLTEAESVLRHHGYSFAGVSRAIGITKMQQCPREYFLKKYFHYIYYKDDIKLELHWRIGYKSGQYLTSRLFDSVIKVPVLDTKISVLKPEAAILVSCINFKRTFEARRISAPKEKEQERLCTVLFFVYEIKRLIRYYYKDEADWEKLVLFCKSTKTEYSVFSLLFLVHRIGNIDFPEFLKFKLKRYASLCLYMRLCGSIEYHDFQRMLHLREAITNLRRFKDFIKNPALLIIVIKECLYFLRSKILPK